jgi:hypothetical protein
LGNWINGSNHGLLGDAILELWYIILEMNFSVFDGIGDAY